MTEDILELEAYWVSRQESAEACAARFVPMATNLARIDPAFGQWRRYFMSRAMAARLARIDPLYGEMGQDDSNANKRFCNMPPDVEEVSRIFDAGRFYRGQPPVLWPELGFSIGAWNGQNERRYICTFSICAGGYASNNPAINHVKISMGSRRLKGDQPWTGSMLEDILLAVVEAWKPNFAAVHTGRHATFIVDQASKNWSAPGWLTYLAFPYSLQMTPPGGVKIKHFVDGDLRGGLLATLCEEPFDIDNPEHMALADEMQKGVTPVQW